MLFAFETSIKTGDFSKPSANFLISGEKVAEKSRFCLCFGKIDNIFLISWINPISSILSASSKTKNSTFDKSKQSWETKSSNLPGVAVIISTPFFKIAFWGFIPTPPKITADLNGRYFP